MHLHEMPDAARTALVNQELPEFEPTPCAPGPALAERRIAIITTAGLHRSNDAPASANTASSPAISTWMI